MKYIYETTELNVKIVPISCLTFQCKRTLERILSVMTDLMDMTDRSVQTTIHKKSIRLLNSLVLIRNCFRKADMDGLKRNNIKSPNNKSVLNISLDSNDSFEVLDFENISRNSSIKISKKM